jgi:hypothetical protein
MTLPGQHTLVIVVFSCFFLHRPHADVSVSSVSSMSALLARRRTLFSPSSRTASSTTGGTPQSTYVCMHTHSLLIIGTLQLPNARFLLIQL